MDLDPRQHLVARLGVEDDAVVAHEKGLVEAEGLGRVQLQVVDGLSDPVREDSRALKEHRDHFNQGHSYIGIHDHQVRTLA